MILYRVLCVVIGYVFGLFQTGFIIGKMYNIDIRDHGSGNSGTTNVIRTLGKKVGIITYFGDALKAVFAIVCTYFLFKTGNEDYTYAMALYTGLGVVLGHNYPFYMNFKGGKGIAASSGVIFSFLFYDCKFVVLGFVTFFGVAFISKYVSLGSMMLMIGFVVEMIVFGQLGMVNGLSNPEKIEVYILTGVLALLTIVRHRENIKRLINGTERKIGEKKEA